jgi:hypothetical protein
MLMTFVTTLSPQWEATLLENDQLKNISQIEHSHHRSLSHCMINVVAGLVAYSDQKKKPSLNIRREDLLPLLYNLNPYPELRLY